MEVRGRIRIPTMAQSMKCGSWLLGTPSIITESIHDPASRDNHASRKRCKCRRGQGLAQRSWRCSVSRRSTRRSSVSSVPRGGASSRPARGRECSLRSVGPPWRSPLRRSRSPLRSSPNGDALPLEHTLVSHKTRQSSRSFFSLGLPVPAMRAPACAGRPSRSLGLCRAFW